MRCHCMRMCANNNESRDILPLNILHRVKLKLIKFSKTNYSNYVHYFGCASWGIAKRVRPRVVFNHARMFIRCIARSFVAIAWWSQFVVGWLHAVCTQTMGETAVNHIVIPVTMQFAFVSVRCTRTIHEDRRMKIVFFERIARNNNSNIFAVHTAQAHTVTHTYTKWKVETWRAGGFVNCIENKININSKLWNDFIWCSPPAQRAI